MLSHRTVAMELYAVTTHSSYMAICCHIAQ